jgi:putative ABC transport system permease protein
LTLALLVSIALGLGSNITVRGFTRGLTIHNSHTTTEGTVVSLYRRDAYGGIGPVSYQDYLELRSRLGVFKWIGGAQISQTVIRSAGHSAIVSVADVTPDLARFFNLPLDGAVVISHSFWQSEFGGEPNIRDERIRIRGVDARIADVAPGWLEGVYSDHPIDIWGPLREQSLQSGDGAIPNFWVIASPRPEVSTEQLKSAVRSTRVSSEIEMLSYTGVTPELADGLSRAGAALRGAAGFVFFLASANVASILLGRAAARSR